jgi:hypothetical protein
LSGQTQKAILTPDAAFQSVINANLFADLRDALVGALWHMAVVRPMTLIRRGNMTELDLWDEIRRTGARQEKNVIPNGCLPGAWRWVR